MKQEPLTESYYYILLCLYQGPSHGYGIMQKTMILSNNRVKIGSGTMYGAVSNMMKKGFIQETKSKKTEDERKRLYELTEMGREVLKGERMRLMELLESAKKVMEDFI
ncbi:MAG: PadR family transcriptional regulator [Velocimicrobium sp.]